MNRLLFRVFWLRNENISTATEKHFGRHNDWGLVFFCRCFLFLSLISAPNFPRIWMKHWICSIYVYDKLQFEVLPMFNVYALSWPWQMLNFLSDYHHTGIQNQFSLQNSTMGHEICAQWKYAEQQNLETNTKNINWPMRLFLFYCHYCCCCCCCCWLLLLLLLF